MFKVIDPKFVLSDTYRDWPLETKATYTVICAMANYKTGKFFLSLQTIANQANLCLRAVQRSFRRMEDADVITLIEERAGGTSIYKYNFTTTIRKDRGDSGVIPQPQRDDSPVMGGMTEQSPQGRLTSHPTEQNDDHQTLITSIFTGTIPFPNKKDLNKKDLTTTYGDNLLSELIKEYGEEKVLENAVAVLKLKQVKNKSAYLRTSLKHGYVPTNQKMKEKEEAEQKRLEYEKRQKQNMAEWEKHVENVKREANDPEIQARIKAEIEKMNSMFNT